MLKTQNSDPPFEEFLIAFSIGKLLHPSDNFKHKIRCTGVTPDNYVYLIYFWQAILHYSLFIWFPTKRVRQILLLFCAIRSCWHSFATSQVVFIAITTRFSSTYLLGDNLTLEMRCKSIYTNTSISGRDFAMSNWDSGNSLGLAAGQNRIVSLLPLQMLSVLLVTEKSMYNSIFSRLFISEA